MIDEVFTHVAFVLLLTLLSPSLFCLLLSFSSNPLSLASHPFPFPLLLPPYHCLQPFLQCAISLRALENGIGRDPHRYISQYADWDVHARMPRTLRAHILSIHSESGSFFVTIFYFDPLHSPHLTSLTLPLLTCHVMSCHDLSCHVQGLVIQFWDTVYFSGLSLLPIS